MNPKPRNRKERRQQNRQMLTRSERQLVKWAKQMTKNELKRLQNTAP